MTVTAPPRPPSTDLVDQDELEALVEALFEEARQRARRRRRIYAASAALMALAAVGTLYGGLAAGAKGRETLLPLLLLPVVAPVLIGATRAFEAAFGTRTRLRRPALRHPVVWPERRRRRSPSPASLSIWATAVFSG